MEISVIVPTHNPDQSRLQATLLGLRAQILPAVQWETIVIDNASIQFPEAPFIADCAPPNLRVVQEPVLGLTAARRCGMREARAEIIVFVDDDNVLAPDYLEQTRAAFSRLAQVGALGGKSLPAFEIEPQIWTKEFWPLLALRDLGEDELLSQGLCPSGADQNRYPLFAPIGAGMAVRRVSLQTWLDRESNLSDRRGKDLTSSGDNDMVLSIMKAGWEVAYIPKLSLNHLIPASRLTADYLARLNHGIQKSWAQVLLAHDACPWPMILRWTVPLRKLKAWFTYQAWSSSAARIRWMGSCGHFEGRAAD